MQSTVDDTWRAALLLVSVFGDEALDYACERRNLEESTEKLEVWEQIIFQISAVLTGPSKPGLQ